MIDLFEPTKNLTNEDGNIQSLIIEERNVQVRPFGDRALKTPWLLDFISKGDPAILPAEYEIMTGYNELRGVTKNLRLRRRDQESQLVVSGFGYTSRDDNDVHEQDIHFNLPDLNTKYFDYMQARGGTSRHGTTFIDQTGKEIRRLNPDPLGGMSKSGVIEKAGGLISSNLLYPKIGMDLAYPKLHGTFAYQWPLEGIYGLVYEAPIFKVPRELLDQDGQAAFNHFAQAEFQFMAGLIDRKYIHFQLHAGNKGVTTSGQLYIGDPETLRNCSGYTDYAFMLATTMMVSKAINSDLSVLMKKHGFNLSMFGSKAFQDYIENALVGFGIQDPENLSSTRTGILNISNESQFSIKNLTQIPSDKIFRERLANSIASKIVLARMLKSEKLGLDV